MRLAPILCSILLLLFSQPGRTQNTLQSPDEFFPHRLGEKFTPHHLLVDYLEQVAENSDRMVLREYGRTHQGRPLVFGIISAPSNIQEAEQIRTDHLRRIGMAEGKVKAKRDHVIVWLSYGVHGNEAGASESSMAAVYELANPANKRTGEWLENTIVIVDPCINPDGYSRYTHWNRNVSTDFANPNPDGIEHNEPWPGGRVNHYLFDLNRDWAWQTQIESSQRIAVYNQWMPHIHVDFHEMGHDDPYYFAPAAPPFHAYITPWQSEFQTEVGKNHARYFDQNGWLYFTREIFDLFYPSYGDTWPTFHGAIGMTYEQGGHSRASRAIQMVNGDTLLLSDRIAHHLTTSLSTVEVASRNADRLTKQFEDYFSSAISSPAGKYRSYIIRGDERQKGKVLRLCRLLDANKISYSFAGEKGKYNGFSYQQQREETVKVSTTDLLISAHQPLSVLVQVLFEPEPFLADSLTYDITAWALPYAYGLEAYALKQKIETGKPWEPSTPASPGQEITRPYAWLIEWNSMEDARFLSAILKENIRVRCAAAGFETEGRRYRPGTLIITRADNKPLEEELAGLLDGLATAYGQSIYPVATGFSEWGPDLGSEKMRLIHKPNVLVLSGESVSTHSFGQVWHYFEQDLGYPLTIIEASDLSGVEMEKYNLLILPEGNYSKYLNASMLGKIKTWIGKGGRIIAIGRGLSALEEKNGFSLKKYASSDEESIAKRARERAEMSSRLEHYNGRERRMISDQLPGAIYKLKLDNTHPLGFGMPDHYFSLKTSTRAYKHLKNTWNVGYIETDPVVIGFVGSRVQEKMKETTVFAVQDKGKGRVIYLVDNPLFRGFWDNGSFLFSNAVFLVQ